MLGRIIALIIALIIVLPVGLIAALSMFFVTVHTDHTGYGPDPLTTYGSSGIAFAVWPVLFVLGGLLLLGLVWAMMRLVSGPGRERLDAGYGRTDTQLIQQLNHIASRLEERIEILETILIDRAGRPEGETARHD